MSLPGNPFGCARRACGEEVCRSGRAERPGECGLSVGQNCGQQKSPPSPPGTLRQGPVIGLSNFHLLDLSTLGQTVSGQVLRLVE
jgi:hypothetical protein